MTDPDAVPGLVDIIRWSGTAPRILREHAADRSGRCPVCRSGGDGSGKVVWPCNLWLAAKAASAPQVGA